MAICFVGVLGGRKEKFSLCKQKIVNEIELRFVLPSDNTCEDNRNVSSMWFKGKVGVKFHRNQTLRLLEKTKIFPTILVIIFLNS